jgi:hypothetical protein
MSGQVISLATRVKKFPPVTDEEVIRPLQPA